MANHPRFENPYLESGAVKRPKHPGEVYYHMLECSVGQLLKRFIAHRISIH